MKKAPVLFAFSVLFTSGAFSQTAQLTGTITDQTGSVVPGTKVVATNIDTGVARASTANDQGNYLVTALLPGSYPHPGFWPHGYFAIGILCSEPRFEYTETAVSNGHWTERECNPLAARNRALERDN